MKRILLSAVALGAMTTAAMAEPQQMGEDQLGGITGGVLTLDQTNIDYMTATSNAVDVGGKRLYKSLGSIPAGGDGTNSSAFNTASKSNTAFVTVTKTVTKDLLGPIVVPCPCDAVKKDHGFKKDFSFESGFGSGGAW